MFCLEIWKFYENNFSLVWPVADWGVKIHHSSQELDHFITHMVFIWWLLVVPVFSRPTLNHF